MFSIGTGFRVGLIAPLGKRPCSQPHLETRATLALGCFHIFSMQPENVLLVAFARENSPECLPYREFPLGKFKRRNSCGSNRGTFEEDFFLA